MRVRPVTTFDRVGFACFGPLHAVRLVLESTGLQERPELQPLSLVPLWRTEISEGGQGLRTKGEWPASAPNSHQDQGDCRGFGLRDTARGHTDHCLAGAVEESSARERVCFKCVAGLPYHVKESSVLERGCSGRVTGPGRAPEESSAPERGCVGRVTSLGCVFKESFVLNEVASEVLPASLANLRNPLRLNEVASDVLPASLSKLRNPVRLNEVASREFSPMLVISGSPQQLAQCIRPPPGLSLPSALMTYVEPLTVSPSQSCVPQAEDTGKTESRGAALHSSGQCKPCRWYWKSEGCRHGEECNHCHLCGPGELAARRMAKTAALRLNPLGPMDASAASRKLQLSRLV